MMAVVAFMVVSASALLLLMAALTGAGVGYLVRRDGGSYPAAILRAGTAFGAVLALVAAVTTAVAAVADLLR
ncbi:hypothetical protein ACGFS9_31815 [Streptomyces sp. NPDC048566]|uniref:hypothetical protein n=1 Tax=Streptomyces sp. NPDC048566 TaxID=3365569 RepID=UPI00371CF584